MSFYINNTNPNRPGPLSGNAGNGLCEKILVEVNKVFDACISQDSESGIILQVTGFNPANPTLPLTFVSAENSLGSTATITAVTVERIDQTPNYANVTLTVQIPVTVTYRDAGGVIGTASSTLTVEKSVMLFVPQPALSPVNITASAQLSSRIGAYTAESTFTITACIQLLIKVVSLVDVLLPSYGYPVIPPAQTPVDSNACVGATGSMPLYPTAS